MRLRLRRALNTPYAGVNITVCAAAGLWTTLIATGVGSARTSLEISDFGLTSIALFAAP